MREINIGAQGFDEIRENGNFYIDKTAFIRDWWEDTSTVTLITRPRRFGKTLNMRMLECFFSNHYAGRSDLFEGLDIWQEEKYRQLQGTFPVIFLTFADIKETSFAQARRSIIRTLQELFDQYKDIWADDPDRLRDRYVFMNMTPDTPDADVAKSLQQLSYYLMNYYGQKVLILLDEYDTPLEEAFVNHYWKEMSDFMRSLFNSTFKTNPAMKRAVLTGITRISKESIFSDLNNPNVVTTTSTQYETAFGFTEEEVCQSLSEYGLSAQFADVKKWYDGFTFGKAKNIYNPWSILNYLKQKRLSPYWANTSSNSLISYELRAADNSIKEKMEGLLNGGTVTSAIDEQIIFSQLENNSAAMWSLLLASGYLKICSLDFDGDVEHYMMALTNHEVVVMFRSLISGWFDPAADSYSRFTKALMRKDMEALNFYLNDILLNVASSFDTRKKVMPGHEPESFYHGLVLGLIATEQNYIVTSNRESGLGRYDVVMRPRVNRNDPSIIIEFKVFNPAHESDLTETADRALQQIQEKQYDTDLLQEGISRESIIHYGMGFRGKEALVRMG